MTKTGEVLKIVRLEIPAPVHKSLRVRAAEEDKSMAALARELVEDGLKRKPRGDSK